MARQLYFILSCMADGIRGQPACLWESDGYLGCLLYQQKTEDVGVQLSGAGTVAWLLILSKSTENEFKYAQQRRLSSRSSLVKSITRQSPPGFALFTFFFLLFRAVPVAYGGSQARGGIVAGRHHSYSNARSEPYLRPTPQLTATPDPEPAERGQGWNLRPHGS